MPMDWIDLVGRALPLPLRRNRGELGRRAHVLVGMNWLVLGLLLLFVFGRKKGKGFNHPPTDDNTLSTFHKTIGIVCLLIFVLSFMPVPMRMAVPTLHM